MGRERPFEGHNEMNMTLAAIAVLLARPAQTVDLSLAAAPLEQVVAKLAQSTGQNLGVSSQLAGEVVLIDVQKAEPQVLLDKVAEVVGGKWVQGSNGTRLEVDLERDKKERQTALDARTQWLKGEIDRNAELIRKQGEFDAEKFRQGLDQIRKQMEDARNQGGPPAGPPPGAGQMGEMMNAMPAGRAIVKLLTSMRADDLAKIAPGQRVVYTTAPTRMQRLLPSNGIQVMRQFITDQSKIAQGIMGARRQGQNGGNGTQGRTNAPPSGSAAPEQQPSVPTKAFLIVTRTGFNDGLNFQLLVTDGSGQIIGNGNLMLGLSRPNPALSATAAGSGTEKSVSLSDISVNAVNVFSGSAGRGPQGGGPRGLGRTESGFSAKPQLPELKSALSDPVKYDPLSIHVEETVGLLAGDENIVALLPDSLFLTSVRTLSRNPTVSQLREAFEHQWGLVVGRSGGFFTVSPQQHFEARESRVDRKALARLIERAKDVSGLRLDDVAAYSLKAPTGGSGQIDVAILRAVDASAADTLQQVYGENRDVLMMYAAMTPQTRENLFQGKSVAATSVSNNAPSLLADLVYNSPDGPRVALNANGRNGTANGAALRNGGNAQTRTRTGRGGQTGRRGGGGTAQADISPGLLASVVAVQDAPVAPGPQTRRAPGGRGGFQVVQGRPGGFGGGPGGMGGPGGTGRQGFGMGNVMSERTEVLPVGVPGSSALTVSVRSEQVAKAVQSTTGASRVFTPQTMATERAMSENPVQGGQVLTSVQWDSFLPGERRTLLFTFTFAPGVTMFRALQDTSFQGTAVASIDSLPGDYMTRYTESYKQAQARFADMQRRMQNGGRGGGQRQNRQRPPAP